jgi:hypothetical protein
VPSRLIVDGPYLADHDPIRPLHEIIEGQSFDGRRSCGMSRSQKHTGVQKRRSKGTLPLRRRLVLHGEAFGRQNMTRETRLKKESPAHWPGRFRYFWETDYRFRRVTCFVGLFPLFF